MAPPILPFPDPSLMSLSSPNVYPDRPKNPLDPNIDVAATVASGGIPGLPPPPPAAAAPPTQYDLSGPALEQILRGTPPPGASSMPTPQASNVIGAAQPASTPYGPPGPTNATVPTQAPSHAVSTPAAHKQSTPTLPVLLPSQQLEAGSTAPTFVPGGKMSDTAMIAKTQNEAARLQAKATDVQTKANDMVATAEQQKADAEAKLAQQQQAAWQQFDAAHKGLTERFTQDVDDRAAMGVNPNKIFADPNFGTRTMALMASGIAGFNQNYNGGRNMFFERMDKDIDRSVAAQESAIQSKDAKIRAQQSLFGELKQHYQDTQLAAIGVKDVILSQFAHQLEAQLGTTKNEDARNRLGLLLNQTQQEQAVNRQRAAAAAQAATLKEQHWLAEHGQKQYGLETDRAAAVGKLQQAGEAKYKQQDAPSQRFGATAPTPDGKAEVGYIFRDKETANKYDDFIQSKQKMTNVLDKAEPLLNKPVRTPAEVAKLKQLASEFTLIAKDVHNLGALSGGDQKLTDDLSGMADSIGKGLINLTGEALGQTRATLPQLRNILNSQERSWSSRAEQTATRRMTPEGAMVDVGEGGLVPRTSRDVEDAIQGAGLAVQKSQ